MHIVSKAIVASTFCSLCVASAYATSTETKPDSSLDSSLDHFSQSWESAKDSFIQMGDALTDASIKAWNDTHEDKVHSLEELKQRLASSFAETGSSLAASAADKAADFSREAANFMQSAKQSLTDQTAVSSLKAKLAQLTTFQSDFIQEIYDKKGSVIATSSGHLALNRPHQFVMHTKSPDEIIFFIRAHDVYYYDAAVNQLSIFDMRKIKDNPFLLLTSQNNLIWSDFKVAYEDDRCTLIPKKNQDIKSLTISFVPTENDQPTLIESISIRMSDGNTNFYRLTHGQSQITDELFSIDLPDDVDIADER